MAETGQTTDTTAAATTDQAAAASKQQTSAKQTKGKAQQQGETHWHVCDTAATKPRSHSARDKQGKLLNRYIFAPQERKAMPWHHALCFVGVPGFEVRNENGKQIRPRPTGAEQSAQAQSLASDEVVANLNELTTEALAKRCQALPGGQKYHSKSGKDGMIAFIIEGGDTDAEIPVQTEDGDIPGQPEMEPEE